MTDIIRQSHISEVPNHPSHDVLAMPSVLQEGVTDIPFGEGTADDTGRLRRLGNSIVGAPANVYAGLQHAAIAFQNDPAESWKKTAEGAAIVVETSPVSGIVRYGLYAAVLAKTGNIPAAVGTLAGSTLLTEGVAMRAMANVLDRDNNRALDVVNKFADKFIRRDKRVTPLAEAVITNYLGVPVLLAVKQREDPKRTREQNIRHGAIATILLTGAIAVQGVAVAEGVTNLTDPKVVVPAVAVLGAAVYAAGKAKKHVLSDSKEPESK
ncbi:hypothetical protein BH10PAT3_BH10PAT3_2410 [soil metagenome]